jgi:hypothetical protein
LAIPINEDSRPIQFSTKQLHLCKQVNSLFLCDLFEQITTVPTQDSCLFALANKQYKDAIHLCNFTISRPNELLYQIQPEQYLLYSADHQPQVYQCKGNNWSGLTITAGISILTVSDECNLNLTEHQITSQAYYQSTPVIEMLPISSVYNRTRNYYIKTQTIIELVACSILLFLSFIAAIRAIVHCSKGTYIRTLGEDIGEAIGCGAHLGFLRRIETGGFKYSQCVSLPALEAMNEAERDACLLAPQSLVSGSPSVSLDAADAGRFLSGLRRRGEPGRWGAENQLLVQVFGTEPYAFLGTAHVTANELIPERLLSPIEVQDMLQNAASAGPALHSHEPPALT